MNVFSRGDVVRRFVNQSAYDSMHERVRDYQAGWHRRFLNLSRQYYSDVVLPVLLSRMSGVNARACKNAGCVLELASGNNRNEAKAELR